MSTTVHGNLLGARALLQQQGFLRLKAGDAPPQEFATFDEFLAAVTDPDNPALNARFIFPSLVEFLNRFDADPNLISMGNWNVNEDEALDTYLARSLQWERPLWLRRGIDRLRIAYAPGSAEPRFDHVGIVYLRANNRLPAGIEAARDLAIASVLTEVAKRRLAYTPREIVTAVKQVVR